MSNNVPSNEVEIIENNNDDNGQKVHRMDNFAYIQEGMHCRSTIALDDFCCIGDVLLIADLHFADNQLHSVEVMAHPRYKAHRYKKMLLQDFDSKFTVISKLEAERVREQEVDAIHHRYKKHEEYVTNLQTDDVQRRSLAMEIYSRRLEHKSNSEEAINTQPMPTNALEIMRGGNAKEVISNLSESLKFHTDILKIESNILAEETEKLKAILNEIIPFTEQRMIGAKASTKEVTEHANRLEQGIASLKLYSGETVTISAICNGRSAPSDLPISMIQERLFADLELGIFDEECGEDLDVYSESDFLEQIKTNPEFVKQIFPTERSIVLMQLRSKDKDYGCPITNYVVNEENRKVFLLVRDGENIYQVFSPIGSHECADKLFPSRTDLDDLFKRGQVDITVDDLFYSTVFNQRERAILHYKRFLLLIAGLDHNHKLFGEFYPQGQEMQIFYPEFQEKYFNFIHDADGEGLIGSGFNYTLSEWIAEHNSKAVVGSRILVDVDRFMDSDSAPSCYKYEYGRDNGYVRTAEPTSRFQYLQIQEDSKGLFIRAEVIKKGAWGETKGKPYNTRIGYDGYYRTTAMLLLSNVKPDHLLQFINNRKYRRSVFSFIGIFRQSLKVINEQFKYIEPLFNTIYESVSILPNLIPMSKEELEMEILDTINMWQTKTKKFYPDLSGTMQKKAVIQICDSLYYRVTTLKNKLAEEAESLINDGSTPLQFTVAVDGSVYLYSTMPQSEQDNRFSAHAHVNRHLFKFNKNGELVHESSTQVLLFKYRHYEHILLNYDENTTKQWIDVCEPFIKHGPYYTPPLFSSYSTKKWVLDCIDNGFDVFKTLVSNSPLTQENLKLIESNFEQLVDMGEDPIISLPIALLDRKILVAVLQNSDEVYKALLNGEEINTAFTLRTIDFSDFLTWELNLALPKDASKVIPITATAQARRIFGPSLHEVCNRIQKDEYYSPIALNQLYDESDLFKFDKLINNPHLSADFSCQTISVYCGYDSHYKNGTFTEAKYHSLYILIGPKHGSDVLRDIGEATGLKLPSSYSYTQYANVISPLDIDATLMAFIKRHSNPNSSYVDDMAKAVQKSYISSAKQIYEREIKFDAEEFKDYKLYCVLNQL